VLNYRYLESEIGVYFPHFNLQPTIIRMIKILVFQLGNFINNWMVV